jgi:hypothetical protein
MKPLNASQLKHPSLRSKIETAIRSLAGKYAASYPIFNRKGKLIMLVSVNQGVYNYTCTKTKTNIKASLYQAWRTL